MRTNASVALLLLAPALFAAAQPALSDYHEFTQPNGWRLFRATEASRFQMEIPRGDGSGVILIVAYHMNGTRATPSQYGLSQYGVNGGIWTEETGPVALAAYAPESGGDTFQMDTDSYPLQPGEYVYLVAAWGDVPWWSIDATGVGRIGGTDDARYLTGADLEGGTYAGARFGGVSYRTPVGGPTIPLFLSAQIADDRSFTVDVKHTLVGVFGPRQELWYAGLSTQSGNATLEGPRGTTTCVCYNGEAVGQKAWGPGAYRFADDTTGARDFPYPLAVWVDVPFPFSSS